MSDEATVVVAQTLKRLYPHNPDVVLGREARTIVAALSDNGWQLATDLFVALAMEFKAENENLRVILKAARDELARWGWGDHHYGATPQERAVVDMLTAIDTALSGEPAPGPDGGIGPAPATR